MRKTTVILIRLMFVWIGLLTCPPMGRGELPALERYRQLKFPPAEGNFDKGWQERVALEFMVVNGADLNLLRAALKDKDPFVRAIATRTLGIRADKGAADAIARLAKDDPEYVVRIRAVEALGLLKMKPDVIEAAKKDKQLGVQWTAERTAGQLADRVDHAAQIRAAYAGGIKREAIDAAQVGKPAPDFTAKTSTGADFRLSRILGTKPIAIYFAVFDG